MRLLANFKPAKDDDPHPLEIPRFPRRAPLSVTIGNPIMPTGKDFASVLHLRDEARRVVLAGCGEPDFGELVKPPHPFRGTFASFEDTR